MWILYHFSHLFSIPFSLFTARQNLFRERPWLLGRTELPYRRQKTPRMRREAALEVFCLTTVYPTDTLGVHGNSGDKSAGKHLFPSGKGRKRPEISGNRYSGFLWDSVEKRQILTSLNSGKNLILCTLSVFWMSFEPTSKSVFDHSFLTGFGQV